MVLVVPLVAMLFTALQLNTNYYLVVSGYQIVTSDFSFMPYFSQLKAIYSRAFTISSLPYSYTGFVDAGLTDNRCATNAFSVWFKFNSGGGYKKQLDLNVNELYLQFVMYIPF